VSAQLGICGGTTDAYWHLGNDSLAGASINLRIHSFQTVVTDSESAAMWQNRHKFPGFTPAFDSIDQCPEM
jgi:hypothetical protein